MNLTPTIFMLLLAITGSGPHICPAPETPLSVTRTTVDGITYSVAIINEPGRFILSHYQDNRTEITNYFHSNGVVTLGHTKLFYEEEIIYYMTVDLPNGTYTVIDEGEELHSRPYEICAQGGQVSVLAYGGLIGPEHGSFVWSFGVEISDLGDINGDGSINGADLAILLSDWGTGNNRSDIDGDGTVGPEDLTILFNKWSQ